MAKTNSSYFAKRGASARRPQKQLDDEKVVLEHCKMVLMSMVATTEDKLSKREHTGILTNTDANVDVGITTEDELHII